MNNVTTVWSMIASCALLLAAIHAIVWLMDRKAVGSVALAGVGFSVLGMALIELAMMHSTTAYEWGEWARWIQVPVFVLLVSILVFVRFYLRTGRHWLFWTILAMRVVILVVNFLVDPSFNFKSIGSIEQTTLLGEQISVTTHVVAGSRQWLGTLSMLLVLVYMGDALLTLWRTGTAAARSAVILIGSTTFASTVFAALFAHYLVWGDAKMVVLLSPPFLILLIAMAFEMSRDTLRASRLARELQESEASLKFAADSAGLGLWSWSARPNRIWATSRVHEMFGLTSGDSLSAERLQSLLHADDVPHVQEVLRDAAVTGTVQEMRFRICQPLGTERWIFARGRSEADESGTLTSIQGVFRDVTDQFQAREENDELRRELAHVERAAVLGKLSSSIAHELSQPLAAILHNAETAEILLNSSAPNLAELREIVADIQRDDLRAGDVISGLRALFTRREITFQQLSVESLVEGVVSLLRADARERMATIESIVEPDTPDVRGDRVHVSQVLINLFLNAMDAVADRPAGQRRVKVTARAVDPGCVEITVADSGSGIPEEVMNKIFEPFFTTKTGGMGMGLSVSRTIVEAHRGKLRAENGVAGGATFHVVLPAFESAPVS